MNCWFASLPESGPCDGQLRACHLIPQQQIKRAVRGNSTRPLSEWLRDPRCWVPGCGGPMGNAGHHGQFKPDGPLPIARDLLPDGLEEFAAELGLTWWLERTYGSLAEERMVF